MERSMHLKTVSGRLGMAALIYLVLSCLSPAARGEDPGLAVFGQVRIFDPDHKPVADESNVVVYLEDVNGNKGFAPPAQPATVASRDMQFVPGVLPILAGTSVAFTNDDDVEHNAFSLSVCKPFDLGLFKRGEAHNVTFDQVGLVKLYCNIHEKMMGYILVLGNSYFATTDAKGHFSIPGVPPGTYKVVSWYRYGDEAEKDVILTNSQTVKVGGEDMGGTEVHFDLVKTHGDPKHKNKWGGDYLGKY